MPGFWEDKKTLPINHELILLAVDDDGGYSTPLTRYTTHEYIVVYNLKFVLLAVDDDGGVTTLSTKYINHDIIVVSNLEFVLLAVDDDGGDLLVHEDKDCGQECGHGAEHHQPPGVLVADWVNEPGAAGPRRLSEKNMAAWYNCANKVLNVLLVSASRGSCRRGWRTRVVRAASAVDIW